MKPPRFGPLGAPVAIVAVWVAVRIMMSVPWTGPQDSAAQFFPPAIVATMPAPIVGRASSPVVKSTPAGHTVVVGPGQRPLMAMTVRAVAPVPVIASASAAPYVSPTHTTDPIANGRYPNLRGGVVDADFVPRQTRFHALTGSAWELINGTGGALGVPSLGGSQLGARLFLQGARAPVALTARLSRALGAHDVEVSAGYALRGRGLGLLVERRQRLDVQNGAFVVTAYGGAYDVRLPAGFRFDGFAQGGVAGVHSRRWFADAQARVTGRAALSSHISLGAGGGTWASAQSGARRVEAGPLVEARLRAGTTGLRVAGEYRFRVTGDVMPRSGPAVTIGMDF